ncbi:MAG: aldehyde dehydrogenase family protein, partial [Yaniella sp.]|nr:aldehyde dehydrogenase family protein [Yaniella sp.]
MALLDSAVWSEKIFLNGWRAGSAEPTDILEPATGNVLERAGLASADDIHEAAQKAAEAQKAWAATKPAKRAAVMRRAGQLFEEHAAELTNWIQRETGAIPAKAGLEINVAANECYDASALPHHSMGDVLTSDEDHWSFARRLPVGVVGVISPFNFPLILSIRSVVPALALGNAVVLKPDPRTPVSGGVMIARALEEA